MVSPTEDNLPTNLADAMDAALEAFWQGDSSGLDRLVEADAPDGPRVGELFRRLIGDGLVPFAGLSSGSQVAGLQIVREIGRGGMGVVYEAQQKEPERRVALKVLPGLLSDDFHIKLFRREIRTLGRLKHASIATIHEAGLTDEGRHFYTMELVSGVPLTTYVREHELTLRQRLRLFLQICAAVNYAHQQGVIHRDLKPSNILVDSAGEPKVLDFGLARITDAEETLRSQTVETGRIIGTLQYMSPEQTHGDLDEIDTRADVYALGVILYELLTGERPYKISRMRFAQALEAIRQQPPMRPSTFDRALRGDLETIVLKALEKEPDRRYQSTAALADDVERYLDNRPILARPPSAWYLFRKLVARHKVPSVSVALLSTLIIGSSVWLSVLYSRADALRAVAERGRAQAVDAEQAADRVTEFLEGMLTPADPRMSKRPDVTVREILDEAAKDVETGFADQPRVEARVREAIGRTYAGLALYDDAEPHLRAALAIREQHIDDNPAGFVGALGSLVELLTRLGRYEEAESLCDEAVSILRERLGNEHIEIANCLSLWAAVSERKGDFKAAEARWRDVLAMRRRLLGEEHVDVAEALKELAWAVNEQGEYDEAEQLHGQAVSILRNLLGDQHDDTVSAVADSARLLQSHGEFAKAEPLFTEVLQTRREQLGDVHLLVAESVSDLAHLLQWKADYDDAEPLFREALDTRRKLLDPEHPAIADSATDLARLLQLKSEYEEAATLFREALDMRRKRLGSEHWEVARSLEDLAYVLECRSEYEEAEELLREAVGILRRQLGDEDWRVADGLSNLARVLQAEGEYEEGESRLREAIDIYKAVFGDEHDRVAGALGNLAKLLGDKGDYARAESLMRAALDMYLRLGGEGSSLATYTRVELALLLMKKGARDGVEEAAGIMRSLAESRRETLPEGHWLTANAESILGACLTMLGRYEEAEPLLINSFPIIRDAVGERNVRTLDALRRIIRLYRDWGKPDRAAEYESLLSSLEELPQD